MKIRPNILSLLRPRCYKGTQAYAFIRRLRQRQPLAQAFVKDYSLRIVMLKILLFLVYPFLEIYLLIKVGSAIGALNMILWIFLSALFGFWYLRMRSEYSILQIRADLAAGKLPQSSLMDSILISIGGVLLILPGLISDAVGLLLFLPPVRHLISKNIQKYFKNRAGSSTAFIFTNTTGFGPGPGGSQDDLHYQGSVFDADAQPSRGEDDQAPRQATVIDSTAIEIEPIDSGKNGTKDNSRTDS